jgi:hypothetical protein
MEHDYDLRLACIEQANSRQRHSIHQSDLEDRDRELIISQLSGVLRHSGSGRGEPGDFAATRIAGSLSRRDSGLSAGVLHTIPDRILVAGAFAGRNRSCSSPT